MSNTKKQLTGFKMIIIKSRKPIIQLGGMTGPITKAFRCSIGMVGGLVNGGHEVYEVVNGEHIRLTTRNYMDDFSSSVPTLKVETGEVNVTNVKPNGTATVEGNHDRFTGGSAQVTVKEEKKENETPATTTPVTETPVKEEVKAEEPQADTTTPNTADGDTPDATPDSTDTTSAEGESEGNDITETGADGDTASDAPTTGYKKKGKNNK